MSLTSLLREPSVRAEFRDLVHVPPRARARPPLVERGWGHPGIVGMAFELALAAGIGARRPVEGRSRAVTQGFALAHSWLRCMTPPGFHTELRARYEGAIATLSGLPPDPRLSDEAAAACVFLARLATVYRVEFYYVCDMRARSPMLLFPIDEEESGEVQDLFAVVPWSDFTAPRRVVVAPEFREGSRLVGGADADLILDDLLLDVKTREECGVRAADVRQVVAYACLANHFGVTAHPGARVDRVGVYVARRGEFFTCPLNACVDESAQARVVELLTGSAQHAEVA